MVIQLFGLIFFGAALYYIPKIVWHSGYFWMTLAVMIVVILLYQNNFSATERITMSKATSLPGQVVETPQKSCIPATAPPAMFITKAQKPPLNFTTNLAVATVLRPFTSRIRRIGRNKPNYRLKSVRRC